MEQFQRPPLNGARASDPSLYWALNGPGHAVHFYDDDEHLQLTVGNFLADGLVIGQPVVSIATQRHTALFAAGLRERGFDVDQLQASRDLTLIDAHYLLDEFTADQIPEADRFRVVVGEILERAGARRRVVRAYGDMVDVLWKDDNTAGALHLEKSWNALASAFHFALLCGYSIGNVMSGQQLAAFEDVCGAHHHVIPTDRRGAQRAGR